MISAAIHSTGSITIPRAVSACACFLACTALAIGSAGCAEGNIRPVSETADFHRQIARSDRPVLVDFYKDNCPTCVIQEAELDQLQQEYGGRVTFIKFKIREATMESASPEVMDEYNLFWVPTVILFVKGQEKQRWVFNHLAAEFRDPLDLALAKTSPQVAAGRPGQVPAGNTTPPAPTGSAQVLAKKPVPPAAPPAAGTCTGQGCPLYRPGPSANLGALDPRSPK
ncbi:MAG: thioredoxin family protein [Phycisphaerae bacterium]